MDGQRRRHLLAGRYEEADVAYAQARSGSVDHPFLARVQLFRALAALRAGKTDLAARHARDAAQADRATVEALLKARRAPALSTEEAAFFARELQR